MRTFLDKICYLDCFKRPINLYSQNNQLHSTKLGTVFSLIIYAFLLYIFVSSDFILKQNPRIIDQTYESRYRSAIEIKNLVVEIKGEMEMLTINSSLFLVKFQRVQRNNDFYFDFQIGDFEEHYELMRQCQEDDFGNQFPVIPNYKSMLCSKEKNFTIKGLWGADSVNFLKISLLKCTNTSLSESDDDKEKCTSSVELDSILRNSLFSIHILMAQLNVNNFEQPISYFWESKSVFLDPMMYKRLYLSMKKVEFFDQSNWLAGFQNMAETYSLDKFDIDFTFNNYNSSILIDIIIFPSSTISRQVRSYQTFCELVSSIGGIACALFIIGSIITYPEFRLKMMLTLMSDVFSFSPPRIRIHLASIKKDQTHFSKVNNPYEIMFLNKPTTESSNMRKPDVTHEDLDMMLKKKCTSEYIPPKELSSEEIIIGSNEDILKYNKSIDRSKDLNIRQSFEKISETPESNAAPHSNSGNFRKFSYSFIDYCFNFLPARCKRRPRKKDILFIKLQEKYMEEMSASNLLRRMQDLEMRVRLLFTREQRELLNLIPKTSIHSSDLNKIRRVDTAREFLEEGIWIYEKLRKSKKISELDKRILNLIGDL